MGLVLVLVLVLVLRLGFDCIVMRRQAAGAFLALWHVAWPGMAREEAFEEEGLPANQYAGRGFDSILILCQTSL
ncbi:GL24739 [Drosophila persimilis]|uniref:GL24739 n=1 Tax=Drosophila persimilis TaxID=7234 RepID=B4H8V1_DROPE|nr:GL24739 [Drosophila persimilis]